MLQRAPHPWQNWLFIVPSLAILALLGLPILALFVRAGEMGILAAATSDSARSALTLSLFTSTLSLILTLAFGTPLAYLFAHWQFRGKSALELLVDLPVILPPSVAGLALLLAFGRRGLFGEALALLGISLPFSTAAVVLAQTFVSAPLYIRSARTGFREIDPQLEEAARVAGADQWQLFRFVFLPLAGRSLLSGAILAWTRALGEFGATILFAGNLEGKTQTMPLAIYLGLERDLGVAIALSGLLVLVSLLLLGVMRKLEEK